MITRLRLQNFQAHKSQDIRFEPGLNVIVGPTDSGKSAIIRAIRWLVQHGEVSGLMTHGENTLRVGMLLRDHKITRFKTSKAYGYQLSHRDSPEPQEYLACARQQPEDIRAILNMTEICFQGQHDTPYLLGQTPGQIAKEINKIVDLSIIDECVSLVKKWCAQSSTIVSHCHQKTIEAEASVEKLSWVPGCLEAWKPIDASQVELGNLDSRIHELDILINQEAEFGDRLSHFEPLLSNLDTQIQKEAVIQNSLASAKASSIALDAICAGLMTSDSLERLDALNGRLGALVQIEQAARDASIRAEGLGGLFESTGKVSTEISTKSTLFSSMQSIVTLSNEVSQEIRELGNRASGLSKWQAGFSGCQVDLEKLEKELTEVSTQVRVCPACGQVIEAR